MHDVITIIASNISGRDLLSYSQGSTTDKMSASFVLFCISIRGLASNLSGRPSRVYYPCPMALLSLASQTTQATRSWVCDARLLWPMAYGALELCIVASMYRVGWLV